MGLDQAPWLVSFPLDLNLLGLEIHLIKVVLDITAVSGRATCWAICCAPLRVCSTGPPT